MPENIRQIPADEVRQWIYNHRTMAQDGLDHVTSSRSQAQVALANLDHSWREQCQDFTAKHLDAWEAFYKYHLNVVARVEAMLNNYVVADAE